MATTATRFDAASDRSSYTGGGGSPPTPSAGWAASWWAYISTDRNDFSTMLRLHNSGGGSTVLNLAMGGTGTAPGAYTAGGTAEVGTQLTVATWYYIGYSVSGSTVSIYVFNTAGALVASTSGTIGGGTPDALTVGGRSSGDSSEWFDGRLRCMRMWSTTRTQAEFAAEQFAPSPVITANLWEHWPLSGAGDLVGAVNGRNLTAGTTATTTETGPPLSEGVSGTATAALGAVSVAVNGQRTVLGQATATLGAPNTVAAGTRTVSAVATVALGGPSATAVGARTVRSVATAALGAVVATVVGARRVTGSGSAALGAVSATCVGRRTVHGSALAASSGVAASVVGRRTVHGVATVALGGVIASVVVSDDHDAVVRARLAPQGRIRGRLGARRARARLGVQR